MIQYTHSSIEDAKEVLTIEAHALSEMKECLDQSFSLAIQTILSCQGRTILIGMGKSGHIANKIASTLSSTGTPACFVHPAEAAHGDLGMIITGDVVIALSNSGESNEILTLIPALKRKGVTIIAITGKRKSALANIADIHILVNINQEACPFGLTPTTSTTVSLAIGDAIAICLLKARHFTPSDFALSHPAGSLGKRLIKVADIMVKGDDVPIVSATTNLKEVIIVITNKGLGLAIIINNQQHVLGIFTDGDLRRLFQQHEEIKNIAVKDIMTPNAKIIAQTILASEALHIMQRNKINALVVTDKDNKLLGVLTMHQLLKAGIM